MGSCLSLPRKAGHQDEKTGPAGGNLATPNSDNAGSKGKKCLNRLSGFFSAFRWKRLLPCLAKKNGKNTNPNPGLPHGPLLSNNNAVEQPNHKNLHKSQVSPGGREPKPVPTVPISSSEGQNIQQHRPVGEQKQTNGQLLCGHRPVIFPVSTRELLRCLGKFVCRRCYQLKELNPGKPIIWFRLVDRVLLEDWQDESFITPASVVFVYLLCREVIGAELSTEHELQATFLTCLYVAYSYMGSETSYPLRPFLVDYDKNAFWQRCLSISDRASAKMLQINNDAYFFMQLLQDLKNEGETTITLK